MVSEFSHFLTDFYKVFEEKWKGFPEKFHVFEDFFQDMDFQESPFFRVSGVGNKRKVEKS